MNIIGNPSWVNKALLASERLEDIPDATLETIRQRLQTATSDTPVVSVIIAAWNEEVNIIRCLDSLSRNKASVPFEIIVVNNNSNDRTQEVLNRLGVTSYLQPIQGVGPSRSLGQQKARGKYILSADADCLYPERWIEIMYQKLSKPGVSFVYGKFSYLGDEKNARIKLWGFELLRDIMAEMRHFKRPYLNSYGISLGYIRENGLKEGYLDKNMRGFDGRLCFDMMKYGKVVAVRSAAAKAWTGTRALERDGSFATALKKRILREIARFDNYFTKAKPHNTKESQNADYSVENSIKLIKRKYNPFQSSKKKT